MDESSGSPKNLDPSAKEFHPTPHQNPIFITPITFFPPQPLPPPPPPPQLFLPYPPPPPTYFHFLQPPVTLPDYVHPSPPPASTGPPSRSLLLTATPPHATEAIVRAEMELFGEVRAVDMERAHEGIVTVHFYDLRDAQTALLEIRAQHMHNHHNNNLAALLLQPTFPVAGLIAGCVVWAQFIIPAIIDSVADGHNHGTIVIFNLDSNVSAQTLKRIFEAFGPVKELRDTPLKRHQKFLEFFDVRDAARASKEMNGKMIKGKQIAIDFSRPGGGHGRRRWCHASEISQSNFPQQQQSTPAPLPSFRKQSKNNICTSPEENIFPAVTDAVASRSHRFQARRPTNKTTTATYNDNNNGSGCSRSFSIISNGGTTAADTVDDSKSSSRNADHEANVADLKNICRKVAGAGGGNKSRVGRLKHTKLDSRFVIREDVITDCGDSRTTVMIKNIPNKYSQKLLLTLLDNHCAHCNDQILAGRGGDRAYLSSYDFVYLPMDFNNKCNVGYGFVNMTSPEATMRLYKAFHCQSWEVFNSRKICQVTYARVQGLQVLKEHFRNSKFPSGSDDIFPVVFEPPRDGRGQLTPPQPIYGILAAAAASNVSSSEEDHGQWNDSSHIGSSMCCADNVDEVFAELRVEVDVTGVEKIRDQNGGSTEDVQLCKKN
ncbi:unnamed protein product [Rhodiola kirilowii]